MALGIYWDSYDNNCWVLINDVNDAIKKKLPQLCGINPLGIIMNLVVVMISSKIILICALNQYLLFLEEIKLIIYTGYAGCIKRTAQICGNRSPTKAQSDFIIRVLIK